MAIPLPLLVAGAGAIAFVVRPQLGAVKGVPTVVFTLSVGNGQRLAVPAALAFRRLQAAAKRDGFNLKAGSGFRSIPKQAQLYAQALIRGGLKGWTLANLLKAVMRGDFIPSVKPSPPTAPPGKSNHNAGTAVDIADVGSYSSALYKWLSLNAPLYGFDNDEVPTEYWHWRWKPGRNSR